MDWTRKTRAQCAAEIERLTQVLEQARRDLWGVQGQLKAPGVEQLAAARGHVAAVCHRLSVALGWEKA